MIWLAVEGQYTTVEFRLADTHDFRFMTLSACLLCLLGLPAATTTIVQAPMMEEKYCGPITWIIGIFLFPCVCCCPCDTRLVPAPTTIGTSARRLVLACSGAFRAHHRLKAREDGLRFRVRRQDGRRPGFGGGGRAPGGTHPRALRGLRARPPTLRCLGAPLALGRPKAREDPLRPRVRRQEGLRLGLRGGARASSRAPSRASPPQPALAPVLPLAVQQKCQPAGFSARPGPLGCTPAPAAPAALAACPLAASSPCRPERAGEHPEATTRRSARHRAAACSPRGRRARRGLQARPAPPAHQPRPPSGCPRAAVVATALERICKKKKQTPFAAFGLAFASTSADD